MSQIEIRTESQINPVGDEVSALIAVIRPILQGLLYALKHEVVAEVGGFSKVKLLMLPRMYRAGDGDIGICFEYAVHDAIKRGESAVVEKVNDGMRKHCKVKGNETSSILFGAEKNGALRLIDTAKELLTDESRLLTGAQAQPVKLRRYINLLAAAFRRPTTRLYLPSSISGAWKADLFIGMKDTDRWVGTSVKTNAAQLEGATGIRVGIVPSRQGKSDKITFDDTKNLVICPLPYDGSFTEIFYSAWVIVQQFIAADAQVPKEASLPSTSQRMVAKLLSERRDFTIVDVIEALAPIAQPELLMTTTEKRPAEPSRDEIANIETLIAPMSRIVTPDA
ncbi:MAG: hypothetical protein M0P72_08430 [Metallibacterium scheffleri]|uniref:hypothetical protein n=1 Tax=Metallibacterium scheffleri TaxID=993689 RepID=UPI0026EEC1AE|nr:hypothetical protein [Metallibacterium scheffleri]MCK9367159.1 hypothetical protein [Metallibacterium scheffleri]